MKSTSTAFKLLSWFCDHPGITNAKTPYDLALAIKVHPGKAIYQRISCDLRTALGIDISKVPYIKLDGNGKHQHWFGYYLPTSELKKARAIRAQIFGPSTASVTSNAEANPATTSSNSGASPSAPELQHSENCKCVGCFMCVDCVLANTEPLSSELHGGAS